MNELKKTISILLSVLFLSSPLIASCDCDWEAGQACDCSCSCCGPGGWTGTYTYSGSINISPTENPDNDDPNYDYGTQTITHGWPTTHATIYLTASASKYGASVFASCSGQASADDELLGTHSYSNGSSANASGTTVYSVAWEGSGSACNVYYGQDAKVWSNSLGGSKSISVSCSAHPSASCQASATGYVSSSHSRGANNSGTSPSLAAQAQYNSSTSQVEASGNIKPTPPWKESADGASLVFSMNDTWSTTGTGSYGGSCSYYIIPKSANVSECGSGAYTMTDTKNVSVSGSGTVSTDQGGSYYYSASSS